MVSVVSSSALSCINSAAFRKALFLGLMWLLFAGAVGCSMTPSDVWVFIDNAGARPLVVNVDDKEAAKIAPGEFAKLVYPPGEHRFRITNGDEVLCDMTRNLEKSDKVGCVRKYLFNPDKNNRYQTYEAKYGVNRLGNVMEAGLLKYQKDPQIKRNYIYKQLLKEVKLVPSDAWNDVTGIDYVLTPPPEYVRSKGTARRSVLARVQQRLYSHMERMTRVENPTDEDIDSLDELIEEILSEAP
jgi:hypothetical protein